MLDVATGAVLKTFEFPATVFDHASFLNDIVVDEVNMVAYMTDTNPIPNAAGGQGGIAVYDYKTDRARKYVGEATNNTHDNQFVIGGANWTINGATDGIALSPDRQTLYFARIQGRDLNSFPTSTMTDWSLDDAAWASAMASGVTNHGDKTGFSDGMTFSADGYLWYGDIEHDALYRWLPGSGSVAETAELVQQSAVDLGWIDTFAFEGEKLLFTSNRLQEYFNGKVYNYPTPTTTTTTTTTTR